MFKHSNSVPQIDFKNVFVRVREARAREVLEQKTIVDFY